MEQELGPESIAESVEPETPKVSSTPPKILSKILKIIGFIFLVAIIFTLGYLFGYSGDTVIKQKLINIDPPVKYKDVDFGKFWEALDKVEGNYAGGIDYNKLAEGAIHGMVSGLDDPFSVYMDASQLSSFNGEIEGTFEGIGTEISIKSGHLVVVAPIEGTPAEKAGLKAGDIIQLIDGENVDGMTIDGAISKIRGKRGTFVTLAISREGITEPFEIKIQRDTINVKSVKYELKDGIAYLRLLRFDQSTNKLIDEASLDIAKNGAKGVVLDLRNNPGGYLDSAINVSSQFIKEGVVVIEEFKDGKRENTNATGSGKLYNIPVVVLVNKGSASASEIVAGAIKDNKRGLVIGEKTFGKGSVQEMQPLSKGGALKITIAKWLTPKGVVIDKNGLAPDIEVKWDGEGEDVQLEKANEELKKLIK